MLREPLLLAIDALGLQAWQMHGETPVRLASFCPGEVTELRAWLARRPYRGTCRILVNLADEAYEIEDLPRVRGADRRALIARRTAAWFAHPEFARAWALGAVPDGRKGFERIVFAGLERADDLRPWLETIRANGTRITRLIPAATLVPAVLATATGNAVTAAGPQLVAGLGRAGLRITLVIAGCVHFSRLVGHTTLAAAAQSPAWLEEIERTLDYLLAQRRLPADVPVPIRVLEAADALHLPPEPASHFRSRTGGALTFLASTAPAASRVSLEHGKDTDREAHPAFDAQLVRALRQAPADLGWQPAIIHGGTLAASPRVLALASLIAFAAIGGGAWYVAHELSAAQAAAPLAPPFDPALTASARAEAPEIDAALATTPPSIPLEPNAPLTPPPQPCPAPEAARPAPVPAPIAAPAARRIDGVLLRPDGEALVWLDGTLMQAREAGLQAASGSEPALSPTRARRQRVRAGEQWAEPAQPVAAPPTSVRTRPADAHASEQLTLHAHP